MLLHDQTANTTTTHGELFREGKCFSTPISWAVGEGYSAVQKYTAQRRVQVCTSTYIHVDTYIRLQFDTQRKRHMKNKINAIAAVRSESYRQVGCVVKV